MEQSVTLNIKQKPDGLELGEVTITRNLDFTTKSLKPEFREFLLSKMKDIFSGGVHGVGHRVGIANGGEEQGVWVSRPVDKNSPVFFETAIEMIENAGFLVSFPEGGERKKLIEKIEQYVKESIIDSGYKLLIKNSLRKLTLKQLEDSVATFEEEFKALNKPLL